MRTSPLCGCRIFSSATSSGGIATGLAALADAALGSSFGAAAARSVTGSTAASASALVPNIFLIDCPLRVFPSGVSGPLNASLGTGKQRRIDTGTGRVDRDRALGAEALEIVRPARLGPAARKPLAPERLAPHHRADHRAVDVEIADPRLRLGQLARARDAAVEPHGEPEPLGVDPADRLTEVARRHGRAMKN